MAWILDTYASSIQPQERNINRHVVTGKPVASGGSMGRDKATAQGLVYCIQEWAARRKFDLGGATFFVQGFGNVGSWAARLMTGLGATLVAVEDVTGAVADPAGIDPEALLAYAAENGGIKGFGGTKTIDHTEFLKSRADIFIPAALGNQITVETAPLLAVKLIAEGANGPTDPDGDAILQERGIDVLPDIFCNSGGVIVSYFEWLQNKRSETWDLEKVDSKLKKILAAAFDKVQKAVDKYSVDWRTGANIVALERLEKVYRERGIFP